MYLPRFARVLAGCGFGLTVASVITARVARGPAESAAIIFIVFLICLLTFAVSVYTLMTAVSWLKGRRARTLSDAPDEEDGWGADEGAPFLRLLPPAWWGALAALSFSTLVLTPRHAYGMWAAITLSVLAGWVHPDRLWRFVGGVSLGFMAIVFSVGLMLDVHSALAGLAVSPLIVMIAAPAAAALFMAGGCCAVFLD
jgi:hypothetical protein